MYHLLSAARTIALCLSVTNNLNVDAFQLANNHPVQDYSVDGIKYEEKSDFRPPSTAYGDGADNLEASRSLTWTSSSDSSINYVSFLDLTFLMNT